MDAQERHNRNVMLQRVKLFWLKGVLEESLHGAELIDLNMAYRPNAIAGARDPGWQQGDEYDTPLPLGTSITQVYDDAFGALLIMGAPGAGKTTTLLQLVTDLVLRAEMDEGQPMPVVLSLATWMEERPLSTWMVDELSNNYEVPRRLGEEWIRDGRLLPLLDGLDEVEQSLREACVRAINNFRRRHVGEPMVVTTRSRDYQALKGQLALEQAIVLQPLSTDQIDQYLAGMGRRLEGLRAALQTDATLRELAQTPLMLSIMTLAYYRMPADVAISLGNREEGRRLLFDVYVERMTRYRSGEKEYPPQKAVRWLSWLAGQMSARNQTMFFLEGMQPSWLPRGRQRQFVDRLRLTIGLLIGAVGVITAVIGLLSNDWPAFLLAAGIGAVAALGPVLGNRFLPGTPALWHEIETIESLDWSWMRAGMGSGMGMFAGLLVGLPVSWLGNRGNDAPWLPWALFLALFLGLSQILEYALVRNDVKMRTVPGQGLARSRRNALFVGSCTALITAVLLTAMLALSRLWWPVALATGVGWIIGAALYLGLVGGLVYGGLAVMQHRSLLATLRQEDVVPPDDYVHFLDYAAERNLLRKVGGGYMFVHALLMDYFVTLEAA